MVVHPSSRGIPRAPRYSGSDPAALPFAYGTLTPCGAFSHTLRLGFADAGGHLSPSLSEPRAAQHGAVWPPPRSLATTSGISFDVFSSPYLDVSVRAVPRMRLFCSAYAGGALPRRVSPFGNLRIVAYVPLPAAYRSLSRPSSAPDAKASPLRSF